MRNATNAANAADAAKVGGRTVQRIAFVVPGGTGPTTVLNLNGLTLTATCAAGPAQTVAATTAVSGAVIHVQGQAAGPVYLADDSFDPGRARSAPASGGTNAIANLVYVRPDGEVVTASYFSRRKPPPGCVFAGTAVG